MPKLGVNIDHIATIRQIRHGLEPEPVYAGMIAQSAGADSLVVHLREDRRHIQDRDLLLLKSLIKIKLNLEMSVAGEIVEIACKVRPNQATLVPEKRQEVTTEGGLDVVKNFKKVKSTVACLTKCGIETSLFIDPQKGQVDAAKRTGVKIIELHTGRYAEAKTAFAQDKYFRELVSAVKYGKSRGLVVNAGHGLNYFNVSRVAQIKGIEELNIGYAIVCRAALAGLERAIEEMKLLISYH